MFPLRPLVAALSLAAALLISAPAFATTYYVSPTGSDSAAGTATAPLKTPGKALLEVVSGDVVALAPGTYASFTDSRVHADVRLTAQNPAVPPVIHGALLAGAGGLAIDHVTFDSQVTLRTHPTNATKFAHDIAITDSTLTSATGGVCLQIRSGSYDVTVKGNNVFGCYTAVSIPGDGIADPAARPMARNIRLLGNTIQHIKSDAVQVGNMDDSVIDGNVVRDVRDPNGVIHNDAIQIIGNSHRNRITNNVLDSAAQLLFTQDALGINDGLVVSGNLMINARAYAVQLGGTRNLTFDNNTVWAGNYGVIWRERSTGTWSHNIIDRYVPGPGAVSNRGYNLTYKRTGGTPGVTDLVGVDPQFVDRLAGDYHLLPTSPAIGLQAGAFLPVVTQAVAGTTSTTAAAGSTTTTSLVSATTKPASRKKK